MSYPQELLVGQLMEVSSATAFTTAQAITAASATVYGGGIVDYPIYVQRMTFRVSTAVNDLTSSIVELQKVSVGGTTTSITTLTVPNGAAAGKVYIKDCSPVKVGIGDKLQWRLKTQGGLGGTPAGAGFGGFLASLQPENYSNETNAITAV